MVLPKEFTSASTRHTTPASSPHNLCEVRNTTNHVYWACDVFFGKGVHGKVTLFEIGLATFCNRNKIDRCALGVLPPDPTKLLKASHGTSLAGASDEGEHSDFPFSVEVVCCFASFWLSWCPNLFSASGRCRGLVQGWESECWGVGGFPQMKKEKFPSVSFQSFQFSRFQRFKVSKIHFMFFGRYCSHIQDFQELIKQILRILRHPSFTKKYRILDVRFLEMSHHGIFQKWFGIFLEVFEVIWCIQKYK